MLTLISPAKKLNDCAPQVKNFTTPAFLDDSTKLNKALRRLQVKDLQNLQYISQKLAELNRERNMAWATPFTPENAQPAIHTFNGEVYMRLDAASFSAADLKFAQDHLRILSGLYGILRPLDLMQPYRLEMGTPLKSGKTKGLYDFWGSRITENINEQLATQPAKQRALVNLASHEYFKAVSPKQVNAPLITPIFKERKDDGYRVIAILAKRARGLMARYIIENRLTTPEPLKKFTVDGYSFNASMSNDSDWVFTRDAT